MISEHNKAQLQKNWLLRETLDYLAELRIYDPLSSLELYPLAIDDDQVYCLIGKGLCMPIQTIEMHIKDLENMHNREGEYLEIDHEYRKRKAKDILKQKGQS